MIAFFAITRHFFAAVDVSRHSPLGTFLQRQSAHYAESAHLGAGCLYAVLILCFCSVGGFTKQLIPSSTNVRGYTLIAPDALPALVKDERLQASLVASCLVGPCGVGFDCRTCREHSFGTRYFAGFSGLLKKHSIYLQIPATGIEPVTHALGKRCSIQLSYASTPRPATDRRTRGVQDNPKPRHAKIAVARSHSRCRPQRWNAWFPATDQTSSGTRRLAPGCLLGTRRSLRIPIFLACQ